MKMVEQKLKLYKPTWERIEFGGRTALGGAIGYAVGKGGELGLILYDKVTDLYNIVIIPTAARVDEKATQAIENLPGGKPALEADKWQGDFWVRLFGRTPEQQQAWRQKHGLEPKTETGQSTQQSQGYTTGTQQPYQPPAMQKSKLAESYGDPVVAAVTLLGVLYGAAKGASRYLSARREAAMINAARRIEARLEELLGRDNGANQSKA